MVFLPLLLDNFSTYFKIVFLGLFSSSISLNDGIWLSPELNFASQRQCWFRGVFFGESSMHDFVIGIMKILHINLCWSATPCKSTLVHFQFFYKCQHTILFHVRWKRLFLYNGCNASSSIGFNSIFNRKHHNINSESWLLFWS